MFRKDLAQVVRQDICTGSTAANLRNVRLMCGEERNFCGTVRYPVPCQFRQWPPICLILASLTTCTLDVEFVEGQINRMNGEVNVQVKGTSNFRGYIAPRDTHSPFPRPPQRCQAELAASTAASSFPLALPLPHLTLNQLNRHLFQR